MSLTHIWWINIDIVLIALLIKHLLTYTYIYYCFYVSNSQEASNNISEERGLDQICWGYKAYSFIFEVRQIN